MTALHPMASRTLAGLLFPALSYLASATPASSPASFPANYGFLVFERETVCLTAFRFQKAHPDPSCETRKRLPGNFTVLYVHVFF